MIEKKFNIVSIENGKEMLNVEFEEKNMNWILWSISKYQTLNKIKVFSSAKSKKINALRAQA